MMVSPYLKKLTTFLVIASGEWWPPRVTPSRGWHLTKINCFVAEFRKKTLNSATKKLVGCHPPGGCHPKRSAAPTFPRRPTDATGYNEMQRQLFNKTSSPSSTVTGVTTLLSAIQETSSATFYNSYLTHWQKTSYLACFKWTHIDTINGHIILP